MKILIFFRSDCTATNEVLTNGIGKDLSSELNNPLHRSTVDYITSHLKVGKYACGDNAEKVSSLLLTRYLCVIYNDNNNNQ